MKIISSTGPAAASTSGRKGPVPDGFATAAVGGSESAAAPSAASAASIVSSLDALMALQEAGGPMERRRRAVARGNRLLDLLDEVKLAVLDGAPTTAALERLRLVARQAASDAGDAGLCGVLGEIDTRAAVELAKAEMALRT